MKRFGNMVLQVIGELIAFYLIAGVQMLSIGVAMLVVPSHILSMFGIYAALVTGLIVFLGAYRMWNAE